MAGHTTEPAFNTLLALALDQRHPRWDVHAEQTSVFRGVHGKPDIVITPRGRAGEPVVIETEYSPADKVEEEAVDRLGLILDESGHVIEQVVAVRIPGGLDSMSADDLFTAIAVVEFEYVLLRGTRSKSSRFPTAGWILGTVDDLAGFCERITLNQRLLDDAADLLQQTVKDVATLRKMDEPATGKQRSYLRSLADKRGIDLADHVSDAGYDSIGKLNKWQASHLIFELQRMRTITLERDSA